MQADHVDVVSHLLPRFEASAQAAVCDALLRLAQHSLRNKAVLFSCARHALLLQGASGASFSLLERLCDLVADVADAAFEPLLRVVVELGSFSFPVAALKRYLFAFSKPSHLALAHYHRLFDTLRKLRARTAAAADAARRPFVHFDTGAPGAGLRAALAEPLKPPSSVSIELWLRLEDRKSVV